ncbi:MAG: hypothetical protein NVSMB56_10040 [Pyrinomonadaceae bacterium]
MPIISIVAAVQIAEALKLLTGETGALHNSLMQFDVWRNEWRKIALREPSPYCPTCARGIFETLEAESNEMTTVLCGRNAVQITPCGLKNNLTNGDAPRLDLNALANRLRASGEVKVNEYLLRVEVGEYELTIFQDARAIIRGTDDVAQARALYARYVGV